jgi:hypothetical protein
MPWDWIGWDGNETDLGQFSVGGLGEVVVAAVIAVVVTTVVVVVVVSGGAGGGGHG